MLEPVPRFPSCPCCCWPVALARGIHPFPSRTRSLSPAARMVLLGRPSGRVRRRRPLSWKGRTDLRVRAPLSSFAPQSAQTLTAESAESAERQQLFGLSPPRARRAQRDKQLFGLSPPRARRAQREWATLDGTGSSRAADSPVSPECAAEPNQRKRTVRVPRALRARYSSPSAPSAVHSSVVVLGALGALGGPLIRCRSRRPRRSRRSTHPLSFSAPSALSAVIHRALPLGVPAPPRSPR